MTTPTPSNLPDISHLNDICLLVDTFYLHIRQDDLLKDIFAQRIQDAWPHHLDKMYRFWQTVLLEERTYMGSPFLPHAGMSLEQHHFDRWINIFEQVVDTHFEGPVASKAKWQANKMAEIFMIKIRYYSDHQSKPLI